MYTNSDCHVVLSTDGRSLCCLLKDVLRRCLHGTRCEQEILSEWELLGGDVFEWTGCAAAEMHHADSQECSKRTAAIGLWALLKIGFMANEVWPPEVCPYCTLSNWIGPLLDQWSPSLVVIECCNIEHINTGHRFSGHLAVLM